ncbi:MAG: hypothetical protein Q8M07_08305 [Prosthecobacter sp.]|nr:hypothetical protein [Prosthecobacter sp.]
MSMTALGMSPRRTRNADAIEQGVTDRGLWLLLQLVVKAPRYRWPDTGAAIKTRLREEDLAPLLAAGWVERRITSTPGVSMIELTDAGMKVVSGLVMWLRQTSEGGGGES